MIAAAIFVAATLGGVLAGIAMGLVCEAFEPEEEANA